MSLLPFGWITSLWSLFTSHGWPYFVGIAVVVCIGVVVSGLAFEALHNETDRWNVVPLTILASALLGLIWPLIAIAIPFVLGLCVLFKSGRGLARHLEAND